MNKPHTRISKHTPGGVYPSTCEPFPWSSSSIFAYMQIFMAVLSFTVTNSSLNDHHSEIKWRDTAGCITCSNSNGWVIYIQMIKKNNCQADNLLWGKLSCKGLLLSLPTWNNNLDKVSGHFLTKLTSWAVWIQSYGTRKEGLPLFCLFFCMSVDIKCLEFRRWHGPSWHQYTQNIIIFVQHTVVIWWDCLKPEVTSPGAMAASRLVPASIGAERINTASSFKASDTPLWGALY